ncbi:unnamed protein product [Mytilus coruscus]|uniref:TIR domain-containing protein n=1 Tax=Mytilus coruscus TaxID=42192 RepID=A0A6J8AFG3_MYTCO|nr:unnamed protein product [Mytilus coruscus]
MNGSLFKFDVSYNYLTTLDITNILWTQIIFCKADFSHNSINSFTNILNWKSQYNSTFSFHGALVGSFNNFTYFSMFNENGFNLKHAGKSDNWLVFARGNHWICDCKVYPFAKSIELFVPLFHQLHFFTSCDSPRQLQNKTLSDIVADSELDQLVCYLSLADWCPPQCHCFYQPAVENRTVVDCSGSKLTRFFFSVLPSYINLEIDFSNNSLRNLKIIERIKLDNFKRIQKLDLSNNNIEILSNIVLYRKPLLQTSVLHDIYISSNEDDELICKWLLTSLVPCLEKNGFDVFLFFMDSTIGKPREQETIDVIPKSRYFIILLSDDTKGNQQWNKKEWKYAWNYYKWDFSRELIIINYDLLTYDDVVKHFFRGFFTLRKVIDFSNFNKNIEEDVVALLK